MDFTEFPQNFAEQKEQEINDALEKTNRKIGELQKKAEKKGEKEAREKAVGAFSLECERSFRGYIRAVGFFKLKSSVLWMIPVGIVIGAIIGFFGLWEQLAVFGNDKGVSGALSCALGGAVSFPIIMLLLRPIVAYTYAIILCPIGYPVFLLVHSWLDKRLTRRLHGILRECEEKYEEKRHMIESEFRKKEKQAMDEIESYKAAFLARMDERAALFSQSPLTDKIADWLFGCFKERYEVADRSSNIENIRVSFQFNVDFFKVAVLGKDKNRAEKSFGFSENRFPEMADCCEEMALCDVLAIRLEKAVEKAFVLDEKASVTVARSINENPFPLSVASAEIEVAVPNPAFTPLKSW